MQKNLIMVAKSRQFRLLGREISIQIPILTTTRLRLEPLSFFHSQGMFDLWSDKHVCQYSGTVSDYDGNVIEMPAKSSTQSDLIVDFWVKAAADGWGFRWAVIFASSSESFAGTIGFNSLSNPYEIAFHLLPDYWGQGIMNEASEAAMNWAKEQGASDIEAYIVPENTKSIALVERLGMGATKKYSDGANQYIVNIRQN